MSVGLEDETGLDVYIGQPANTFERTDLQAYVVKFVESLPSWSYCLAVVTVWRIMLDKPASPGSA